jgi:hypothetical protein
MMSHTATASPIIAKFRSTACLVFKSDWYEPKVRPWVNAFMFPMASKMSCRRDGVSISEMNQIFFNERQVTGFYAFTGD